jgi:hypothetical protein
METLSDLLGVKQWKQQIGFAVHEKKQTIEGTVIGPCSALNAANQLFVIADLCWRRALPS